MSDVGRPRKYTIIRRPTTPHPIDAEHLPVFSKETDGCRYSPSCFTCPLPECNWAPGAAKNRSAAAAGLKSKGVPMPLIAAQLGISRRTAQKYVKEGSYSEAQSRERLESRVA